MKGVACSRALQPPAALYYVGSYSSHIHKLHKSSSSSLSPVSPPSICLSLSFPIDPRPPSLPAPSPAEIFLFFSSSLPLPLVHRCVSVSRTRTSLSLTLSLSLSLSSLRGVLSLFLLHHSSRRRRTSDRWLSRRNSFPRERIRLIAVIGKSRDIMRFFLRLYFVAGLPGSAV